MDIEERKRKIGFHRQLMLLLSILFVVSYLILGILLISTARRIPILPEQARYPFGILLIAYGCIRAYRLYVTYVKPEEEV